MIRRDALRTIAIVLALTTAGIHLTLSFEDLIPGERTKGFLFALMGAGYLVGAVGIFFRKVLFYWLVLFYSLGLIVAYASSRDALPIEPIGISTKILEAFFVLAVWQLTKKQPP